MIMVYLSSLSTSLFYFHYVTQHCYLAHDPNLLVQMASVRKAEKFNHLASPPHFTNVLQSFLKVCSRKTVISTKCCLQLLVLFNDSSTAP